MLVECPTCQAKVDGTVLKQHIRSDPETDVSCRTSFVACPSCNDSLLVTEEAVDYDSFTDQTEWSEPQRIYPAASPLPTFVPDPLRRSFQEARTCLHAGCYLAAALMCRRTLEGLCHHHGAGKGNLASGLVKLHEQKIIDDRLFEWAEALRGDGNLAAHDPQANISHRDAADLVQFTQAILDYVFVLHHRFEEFKQRRAVRATKEQKAVVPSPTE